MKLIHYINKHYEEEECLYDVENDEIILMGNNHHDKISVLIEAFFFFNDYEYKEKMIYLDRDNDLYEKFNFYDKENFQ